MVVIILFLIVTLCGMIVACINLCINEVMRRQGAYRLAWDQRIERDRLQRSDNIIKVTSEQFVVGVIYPENFSVLGV